MPPISTGSDFRLCILLRSKALGALPCAPADRYADNPVRALPALQMPPGIRPRFAHVPCTEKGADPE